MSEHQLFQELRSGNIDTFTTYDGTRIRYRRASDGYSVVVLPDGRWAKTPGHEGMIELRGSVSYLKTHPDQTAVKFDKEGSAHVPVHTYQKYASETGIHYTVHMYAQDVEEVTGKAWNSLDAHQKVAAIMETKYTHQ